MKRILLIGKNSNLATFFSGQYSSSHDIRYTSSNNKGDETVVAYNLHDLDIPLFPGVSHAIIFAGISNINEIESNRNSAFKINFEGTSRLINGLNKQGIKTLFISSSAVFSNSNVSNYEYTIRAPNTYYGCLKRMVEDVALSNDMNSVVRLSKCFGKNSIIKKWTELLYSNNSIECFDDLLISPVPMSLVSRMISDWICGRTNMITHISSSSHISYYQLGKLLAKYLNKNLNF